MNPREHALKARLLTEACGGPREAAAACRVSEAQLSKYCDVQYSSFMPADVIGDLEAYCGQKIYSRALAEDNPAGALGDLMSDACDEAEEALALQSLVRKIVSRGRLTPAECDQARRLHSHLTELVRRVGDDLSRTGCPA